MEHSLAARIQHTLLRPGVSLTDVQRQCDECLEHGFNAAMVPPRFVGAARRRLDGSAVLVASAVDFPFGLMTRAGRVAEAQALEGAGAQEIDLGIPVGLLHDNRDSELFDEIASVVVAVSVPVKAMLDLPLLNPRERDRAVALAVRAGVAFVKNASGGDVGTATPDEVRYLRSRVPASVRVKASGGIRTREHVEALLAAGADVVGTSSAVEIVTGTPQAVAGAGY